MKTIGRTEGTHDYIMEVTKEEYWALDKLADALEGKSLESLGARKRDSNNVSADFSGVFGAILAFALAKFRTNEIRRLADEFDRAFDRAMAGEDETPR